MDTDMTRAMLLVVLREYPPHSAESVWVTCKSTWRHWLSGPGKWHHIAYTTAGDMKGIVVSARMWGNIPLMQHREELYTYTASNMNDKTTARHYEYKFTDVPSSIRINREYSVSKSIIEDDVHLKMMPCIKVSPVFTVRDIYATPTTYRAFHVSVGGRSLLMATRCLIEMVPATYSRARRISMRVALLLWCFMCSYRFDILEYLAELGITF